MNDIEVSDVSKQYRLRDHRNVLVLDLLRLATLQGLAYRRFNALDGVNFSVRRGESFGIVGRNGSGKSTLLRVLAGVTPPTRGTVRVHGAVSTLLELGAGFHSEMTGRENIFLSGALLGLDRQRICGHLDEIIDFSELGEFVDQPIYTYSSGMLVRLGFSVALCLDPDILILDEVLAVGDQSFRSKSFDAIRKLKQRGKTIVLVSHDVHDVASFCDRSLLLDRGKVIMTGRSDVVVPFYIQTTGAMEGHQYIRKGSLNVAFNNGRLHVFRRGFAVTGSVGLYSTFFANRAWYDSVQAGWKVEAVGADRLVAVGRWHSLPLVEHCTFELRSEDEIGVEIWAEIEEDVRIDHYHVSALLNRDYDHWGCADETGTFPDIEVASHDWVHVNPRPLSGCVMRAWSAASNQLPTAFLEVDREDLAFAPTVLNTDLAGSSRVLQFLRIHKGEEGGWSKGRRELFHGTFRFE